MKTAILKRIEKLEAIKAVKNSQSVFLVVADGESEDEKISNSNSNSNTTFIILTI